MKVLLNGINSKYIHSNPAIRYLKEMICSDDVSTAEFTINQNNSYITDCIIKEKPDVIGFSCYIWNIEKVKIIGEILKKAYPEKIILLGGPEVSSESIEFMKENPWVDIIAAGEGENIFAELWDAFCGERKLSEVKGIFYRISGKICCSMPAGTEKNLDKIPFPYFDISEINDKYIYYETSRGCPFNCGFCISSGAKKVRSFSMNRIKSDLNILLNSRISIIKFVDRTFNYDSDRAVEIMNFIMDNNRNNIKIHLEMEAGIMNGEFIEHLGRMPEDMFQLEIGIQSTNPDVLIKSGRKTDIKNALKNIEKIIENRNMHVHTDLIAGLPGEDVNSFINSFNDVYRLKSHKIQLGFLKVLKGTSIYHNSENYGIEYCSESPYEIIKSDSISYEEILKLKRIDILIESFYNEGRFSQTFSSIENKYDTPFIMLEKLNNFLEGKNFFDVSHKKTKLYEYMFGFLETQNIADTYTVKAFVIDFLTSNRNEKLPHYIKNKNIHEEEYLHLKHELLKNPEFAGNFFAEYEGKTNKKIVQEFRLVRIFSSYYVFKYKNTDINKCDFFNINKYIGD